MSRKLSLGRTGSKHKNKMPKLATEEAKEAEEVELAPRELKFTEDEIAVEVRRAVCRLVEQVRREHKDRWMCARADLREAAQDHNEIQESVLPLSPRLQGLALGLL